MYPKLAQDVYGYQHNRRKITRPCTITLGRTINYLNGSPIAASDRAPNVRPTKALNFDLLSINSTFFSNKQQRISLFFSQFGELMCTFGEGGAPWVLNPNLTSMKLWFILLLNLLIMLAMLEMMKLFLENGWTHQIMILVWNCKGAGNSMRV